MKCALSKQQKDILLGLLLGDGSLESSGFKGSRLQVKQSENKKEYVFWLYQQFSTLVRTPPQQRRDTMQWYFGTRYFEDLMDLRNLFYKNRKKVVPSLVEELFDTPITLAIWYMDDGRLDYRAKSHYAYSLSTDAFTQSEVQVLQRILQMRFGIRSSIQMSLCRGKRYPKLYIGKDGRDAFYRAVSPYILTCFSYKLPPLKS